MMSVGCGDSDHSRSASLNVALFNESDGPGGAEQMLLHLGEALRDRGHEVLPVLPAEGYNWLQPRFREMGISPEPFRIRFPLDPVCLAHMVALLRRRRIDVVHSHEFAMAVYGTAATRLVGIPHVITLHGGRYYEAKRRRRTALRWACRNSRSVVTVSFVTRDRYAGCLRIAPERLGVIPNGVPPQPGDRGRVRAELRLESEELLLVAVGNLYAVKGHATLIESLGALDARRPELKWRLAIAGRGEEEAALSESAGDLGLSRRIHLLGYRSDIADVLAAADVFVMPSLSEGLPLALLEAMFAAKPVVASDVGGIPEVVRSGREALLVPPGNAEALERAIETVLSDSSLRDALGAAARRRVEARYTVSAMTDAYEELYLKVVA